MGRLQSGMVIAIEPGSTVVSYTRAVGDLARFFHRVLEPEMQAIIAERFCDTDGCVFASVTTRSIVTTAEIGRLRFCMAG